VPIHLQDIEPTMWRRLLSKVWASCTPTWLNMPAG